MRTTLTLDDDVAAALERLRASQRRSLKELVNEAMRLGLQRMAAKPERREPFRTKAVSLGTCRMGRLDNVAEVLSIAEGDSYR